MSTIWRSGFPLLRSNRRRPSPGVVDGATDEGAHATGGRAMNGHGGQLALAALEGFGVREIFTLSGGHLFPFYDACVKRELGIYDVRHEQTAAFAAEGMAKLTRRPGVA